MDKSELGLIIKAQLFAHRNNSICVDAKKHKDKERERIMQQYFVNGHQICRKSFSFAHAIGKHTNVGCTTVNIFLIRFTVFIVLVI
jgi:hypothetical protein